ncbi:RHS repeat-associated core domain-containing protein [Pragia fontium]|uniref:RHS repeat-associated core domain-containing protein n=1 Tax=Pragia fontium TaxID=82985 RepID=UPI000F714400|nr:RHS repeat-associated core domain-containing protein [Pragia fontium]VEJ57112.1 Cell wall-associated polypeptide CWBP200 [Pragia fontium]
MLHVVKHLDPVIGLDVHTVFIPPSPTPVPIPHPHVGAVLDLREQVNAICPAIASAVSFVEARAGKVSQLANLAKNPKAALIGMASSAIGNAVATAVCGAREPGGNEPVKVNGILRATVGTHSFHIPGLHFPLGTGFGPPDPLPSQDAEAFMGSKTVLVNGDPLSYAALPSMSCWYVGLPPGGKNSPHTNRSHKSLPTSIQLPIPLGRQVLVGGTPVPDMFAIVAGLAAALAAKAMSAASSKVQKMVNNRKNNKKSPNNKTENECKNDPVNVVTGEVVVEDLDFVVSGRVPLVWARSYAGQYETDGQIGHNWESLADTRLEVSKEDNQLVVVATFCDYETAFGGFPLDEGWEHRIYDGQNGHALYLSDGHLILRTSKQQEYIFPVNQHTLHQQLIALKETEILTYHLSKLLDRLGNGWLFERNDNLILRQITEVGLNQPTGRYIECISNAEITGVPRLTDLILRYSSEQSFAHTLVQYRYDDEDNLAVVMDANGHPYHYRYSASHLMIQHTNRTGFSFYYQYEPQSDGIERVVKAWADDNSYGYQFVYHLDRQETLTTDSRGYTETLQYDDRKLPIVCIDALGGVTSYEYDGLCRLIAEVDPIGGKTEWIYDAQGRIIEECYPDGATLSITYDEQDNPISISDPLSNQWQQQYDDVGRVTAQFTPTASEKRYQYDQYGHLAKSVDGEGHETTYRYDDFGFLIQLTDSLEQPLYFKRDYLGNITERIMPNGEVTRYLYDNEGLPVYCRYPDNRTIACQYDKAGHLVKFIENDRIETRFSYWGVGLLTERINPDNSMVRYHYDTEGDLVAVENQKGESWQLKRDELGRLIEEVDYWGKSRHYRYNQAGHLLESLDPLGNRLAIVCDKVGRILSKIANDNPDSEETYRYDPRGYLTQAINQSSDIKRIYNADGLLIKETQQQADINAELDYRYNRCHQLIHQSHQIRGRERLCFEQNIDYQYNQAGQLIAQQVDDHEPIQFSYDRNGRLIQQQFNSTLASTFSYNQSGQIQQQRLSHSEQQIDNIDYYYDDQGNLIRRDDVLIGVDRYQYDRAGQIVEHTDPMNKVSRLVYDVAGNRYQPKESGDEGRHIEFSGDIHYRLDNAGQLVYRHTPESSYQLSWDELGRLTTVIKGDEKYAYQYDALRRRVNKRLYNAQGQLSKTVYFLWDGDALIGEVEVAENVSSSAQQTAQLTFFVYHQNTFIPLVLQSKQQGIGSLAPPRETGYYFYQNDPNGMPLRLRDEQGEIVWLAHYTVLGQTDRLEAIKVKQPLRLQGQYFDEESGLHYNRHRYYDPQTGIFISQDPIGLLGGLNPYNYAPNVLGWVDPLGLVCDARYERYKDFRAQGYTAEEAAKLSKLNMTDQQLVQNIADISEKRGIQNGLKPAGGGHVQGSKKHNEADNIMQDYKNITGEKTDLVTEQPYLNGQPINNREKGSSVPDVYNTKTGDVYDYKYTKDPNSPIPTSQQNKNTQNLPKVGSQTAVHPK